MLPSAKIKSWGNYPTQQHAGIHDFYWRDQIIPYTKLNYSYLPYGQGRSYGDSCLNENGILLRTAHLNRLLSFDREKGILECESGITLGEILAFIIPQGWFLPVLPGTHYVSLGGAIANDIHGKNHHQAGTFGRHILSFDLRRSNNEIIHCSLQTQPHLYRATIGGLGLTGVILKANIQLQKITSPFLRTEYIPFQNLDAFFQLAFAAEKNFLYSVAWLDCAGRGKNFGRGIFMRANHVDEEKWVLKKSRLSIPCYLPHFTLNSFTIRTFNQLYFRKQLRKKNDFIEHYQKFFFPLDNINNWNRIYGKRGFLQYQCVIPLPQADKIHFLLKKIVHAGQGSFLSVLKLFGQLNSPGMLSFPMPGVTLALDFPHYGEKTLALLTQLDEIVVASGGKVYPAKDARMSAQAFKQFFPQWREFTNYIDPKFSSSFWRRVTT